MLLLPVRLTISSSPIGIGNLDLMVRAFSNRNWQSAQKRQELSSFLTSTEQERKALIDGHKDHIFKFRA
jgi:hypothetical protein